MQLARALATRLFFGVISLLFISLVTFVADEMQPGDRATVEAGEKATPETVARIRENLGLNRPWPVRYVEFMGKAAQLDFGKSYHGVKEPVKDIIQRNLSMTLTISTAAIVLASAVGIFLGTVAAIWQNRPPDRTVLILSTFGVTVPNFVLAPVLAYIFALQLDYLPLTWSVTRVAPDFMYLILPVVVLAMRPTALLTRLTRASMVETLQQEFIRTATAKGVPPFRLYIRHALRNAILPVITAIGTSYGFLLTGSFVVETFFLLPGLGSTTIDAIRKGDMPVIQACVLLTGALFIALNLLVDLALPILDPRIRESQV
ncbi:MAG: ABC transporter permease [Fimbriimonadaceae bacterium]|nr:ABC transporter permease [Fimbriimonadaceae bacterium]